MNQAHNNSQIRFHKGIVLLLCLFLSTSLSASLFNQDQKAEAQRPQLDGATRAKIIDWISEKMNEIYVFPDVAKKMENLIRKKLADGDYDKLTDPVQFTRALRKDLVSVSNDRHFNVVYAPQPSLRMQRSDEEEEKKRLESRIREWKYDNFKFHKAERLAGNVGYIRFDQFAWARYAGNTAVAALQFLRYCDALILDLRSNGGGSAGMIQLIISYFFDETKHINSWYIPRENKTDQSWTYAYVPGEKLVDVDLYILTSGRTFSAAEEFTYDLQKLKRAVVVGETTGGGGHTVTFERNDELKIEFKIPDTRAINPVSGDNWEGRGIEPDVKCTKEEAFDKAYILALQKLHDKAKPGSTKRKWINWVMGYQEALSNPKAVSQDVLKTYVGTYGPARVTYEDNVLYVYQPGSRSRERLLAVTEDMFIIEGTIDVRIQFEKDNDGNVVAAFGLFFDGSKDRIPKIK